MNHFPLLRIHAELAGAFEDGRALLDVGRSAAIYLEERGENQLAANEQRRTTPRETPALLQPDA